MKSALTIILALGVLSGLTPAGQEARAAAVAGEGDTPACSSQMLRGSYAFTVDGTILGGPQPVLLRGVAMTQFDGDGHGSQVDYATFNGVPGWPGWREASVTYQVNADCTGTAEIVPPVGPAINLRLVVSDGGRQVATVVVAGPSVGSLGTKVR